MRGSPATALHRATRHAALAILPLLFALALAGCTGAASLPVALTPGGTPMPLPQVAHIVVVVEENHGYDQIVGSADAPYINALAAQGAVFTNAHGVAHPSQPNYLALFAGSTFGITSDACPQHITAPNLASTLATRNLTFVGYAESLPQTGYTGCDAGGNIFSSLYARKHAPWVNFSNVPASVNQPFSNFPTDFNQLPSVAFVIPNQQHDMHSGSVGSGDHWLQQHLDAYARWAPSHNSLLIVTWDEDDGSAANHILTLFIGTHVQQGRYGETVNHYNVLRTIEALFGVPYTINATSASTIADVWQA
jgi:hypothetical protein